MTQEEIRSIAKAEYNRYHREYRARNPDKIREINARYRAKKKENELNREGAIQSE